MPNSMTVQVADLIRAGYSTRRAARHLSVTVSQIANWRARAIRHGLIQPVGTGKRPDRPKVPKTAPAAPRPAVSPGKGIHDPGNGCRYIAGEPRPALYCGHPRHDKSSFCPEHHAVCWYKSIANAPRIVP